AAVNRLAFGMARELQPHQVAVVALAPGFVRTERVLAAFAGAGRVPENLESPEYIGRAVVALAGDANVMARSGRVLTVGQLDGKGCQQKGVPDIRSRLLQPNLAQGWKEHLEHRVAGLLFLLALEFLLELIQGQGQGLCRPCIRGPRLDCELDDAIGGAVALL